MDQWGKRRLAYPIRSQLEAYYVVTQFKMDPQAVRALEGNLDLAEDVMRHLVVRLEERVLIEISRPRLLQVDGDHLHGVVGTSPRDLDPVGVRLRHQPISRKELAQPHHWLQLIDPGVFHRPVDLDGVVDTGVILVDQHEVPAVNGRIALHVALQIVATEIHVDGHALGVRLSAHDLHALEVARRRRAAGRLYDVSESDVVSDLVDGRSLHLTRHGRHVPDRRDEDRVTRLEPIVTRPVPAEQEVVEVDLAHDVTVAEQPHVAERAELRGTTGRIERLRERRE